MYGGHIPAATKGTEGRPYEQLHPLCGGLIMDYGDGEKKCSQCSRAAPVEPTTPANNRLTVNIQLTPTTLAELYSALALAKGLKPVELLQAMGLTAGQAKQMATSNVVYPTAVVALVEQYSVTPSQLVALMKGQARANTPSTSSRPRGRARKTEESND